MIQFHCYPGGKKRVVTFSYDDGFSGDVRLAELFNRYGVKATFHINGSHYRGASAAEGRGDETQRSGAKRKRTRLVGRVRTAEGRDGEGRTKGE